MENRAAFMRGRFGVMSHWLYNPVDTPVPQGELASQVDQWNRRVDAFDTQALADQLQSVGAGWFILTIGQNSGFYCAPNPVYDALVGYPLSKCAQRDLFADLARALKKRGIRAIAYLPSGAPCYDPQAMQRLEWTDGALRDANGVMLRGAGHYRLEDLSLRLASFQRKWEQVITCWAQAWGDLCDGWWIDGVYYANAMYRFDQEPNFDSLARALRSGNPRAAICLNQGILRTDQITVQSVQEDYTAGELGAYLYVPFGRKKAEPALMDGRVADAQLHLLSFLGEQWGQGVSPRLPPALSVAWTQEVLAHHGAVTWDVPTGSDGKIAPAFLPVLRQMGELCAAPAGMI